MQPAPPLLKLPPGFQYFNARGAFRNYERNLPHWRQPGASYFLTFRLRDSLPYEVIMEMKREQEIWRERIAHELRLGAGNLSVTTAEDYEAFVIRRCRRLELLMDEAYGSCVFKKPDIRQRLVDILLHFHRDRYLMHGLVVMPNHVHLSVQPLGEWQAEDLLKSWKGFSARTINQHLGRSGSLWQADSWNRIIRDEAHWHRVMRYIMSNPARAKCWNGESTVWVYASLVGGDAVVREDLEEEPW